MIEKVKQTTSEKLLLILFIILGMIALYIFVILPQKCLFVKNHDPKEINFKNPENIAILNVNCGNIIIKLYPDISPKSVKRFKMLIASGKYDGIAFHRVIKNVLVQSGDLEFGKKDNVDYLYIGTGKSGYGTIKSELNDEIEFKVGTVGMARTNKLDLSLINNTKGFLTEYSMTTASEDMAEIFSFLMAEKKKLEDIILNDPVLNKKTIFLKNAILKIDNNFKFN